MTKRSSDAQRRQWIGILAALLLIAIGVAAWALLQGATHAPPAAPAAAPTLAPATHETTSSPQPAATAVPTPVRPAAAATVAGTASPTATARQATATSSRPAATPTARPAATATSAAGGLVIATPLPGDRMRTIRLEQLPAEAHETIRLIARGGPFPYRQDGAVFENREGRLPRKPTGYYREYTVITPGSADRGARRLVRGEQGELYYTDDHYNSFRRVIP